MLGVTTYSYDSLARIDKVYDGLHPLSGGTAARDYDYDGLDRVKKITFADGKWIQYFYDDDGNRTSRTEGSGTTTTSTTTYTFDKLNRLTQVSLPGGATNVLTYDLSGNLASFQDSGGTTTYTYDPANLLTKLAEPGGSCTGTVSLCTTFQNNTRRRSHEDHLPERRHDRRHARHGGQADVDRRQEQRWHDTPVLHLQLRRPVVRVRGTPSRCSG